MSNEAALVAVPGGFRFHGGTVIRAVDGRGWIAIPPDETGVRCKSLGAAMEHIDKIRDQD